MKMKMKTVKSKFYGILGIASLSMGYGTLNAADFQRLPANLPTITTDQDFIRTPPPIPHIDQGRLQDSRKFPKLWLGSVRWEQTTDPVDEYRIDESLNSILVKNYNFQIFPQVQTPSNETHELKEGYYVLRMVILRPLTTEEKSALKGKDESLALYKRYVSGVERIVKIDSVESGSIRTKVSFEFRAISATTMRNTLLIQVLPVKKDSLSFDRRGLVLNDSQYELSTQANYQANVIRIPFVPRMPSGMATPPKTVTAADFDNNEETLDLGVFINQAETILKANRDAQKNGLTPQTYAQENQLSYLEWSSSKLADQLETYKQFKKPVHLSSGELKTMVTATSQNSPLINENTAISFCKILVGNLSVKPQYMAHFPKTENHLESMMKSEMFKDCIRKPEDHMTLVRQLHIQKISHSQDNMEYLGGNSSALGLSANFATNRSQSKDYLKNWNYGFNPLIAPIDLKGTLKLGKTYTVNESHSRTKSEGSMVSNSITLDVLQWDIQFKVESYTSCLSVLPRVSDQTWKFAATIPGIYICDERPTQAPLLTTERYYHIYPAATAGSAIDLLHPNNQPANLVLRGQREYSAFIKAIKGYLKPIHDQNKNIAQTLAEGQYLYQSTRPAAPSILSYVLPFQGPEVSERQRTFENPTFWDRMLQKYSENLQ